LQAISACNFVYEQGEPSVRVLITGITGFAGSHLAERLLTQAHIELWGTSRGGQGNIAHLTDRVTLRTAELTDYAATRKVVEECAPARIFHLAGQAFVPVSWQDPWTTLENNIRSQLNVLQAIVELQLDTRILCVGSQELYGRVSSDHLPISEETSFRPDSPYGVSKVTQDLLGLQYFLSYGMHTVRARPFNHIGPRQNERFAAPAFAKQIAEIEKGLRPPVIEVGNLDSLRDFTDVRDTVHAYDLLLEHGKAGEAYNIGRGVPVRVGDMLDQLLALTDRDIEIRISPERLRPSNVPVAYADVHKLKQTTGWEPHYAFTRTLETILEDWRMRV
jgi:GDP-4-dehydro-6-deoxy-D-mannose reductase